MDAQPPVVALAEVVEMLGVSRARVAHLMRQPGFPAPVARLRVGQIWSYQDIAGWAERKGRTLQPIQSR